MSVQNTQRAIRGGSWVDAFAANLRAASRFGYSPAFRFNFLGFRCAL